MKFWAAFITPFFMTAILQAQIPYGAYNVQPYYPGTATQPYYPGATTQPYYPQAYYPQPYYVPAPYESSPLPVTDNSEEIDLLNRQVQQLSDEVRDLQAQLASVQAQPAARPVEGPASSPPVRTIPVALVFKNGTRIDAQGYAIAGQTLWILNPSGSERVPLSQLNVAATQTENFKRGVHFPDLGNGMP